MNAQPAQAYLGIGEVLAQLHPEFPDIRVSKIRFLESEGLIAPARSPSGYRRFSPADVQRLRYILTAQRDQYLPLRIIRERLARPGPAAAAPPDRGQDRGQDQDRGRDQDRQPAPRGAVLSRRELLDAAGIDDDQLGELEAYGLVRRIGRQYGQDALEVAVTVAALAAYGVQARHLRAVRAAAEREISLIEQVVAPTLRQRNPQSRELAAQTARQIAALLLPLHRALIEAALAEAGLPGEELPGGTLPGRGPGRGPEQSAAQRASDRARERAGEHAGGRPGPFAGRGVEGASA